MQEKINEIASRVRELRELSDFTIEQMADELGIDKDVYASYENAEKDVPASVLCEIAKVLKVDTAVLLTGEDAKMHVFTVTRNDKGVSVERRKQYKYQSLASNFINKKFEPFIVTVEPKDESEPVSTATHQGQEFNYLLEGRLKVFIHNNEIVLEAGDCIYFDSSFEHAMRALDGKSARFLAVVMC